uniref:Uncharacterized protein n=1 Tax=Biomphalaria glabrata TaxID=6526 RepID=A0A2C9KLB8_BIOGL
MARDCQFRAVSTDKNEEDAIRDAFVSGMRSSVIRQKLLEKRSLDLKTALDISKTLDMAQKESSLFSAPSKLTVISFGIGNLNQRNCGLRNNRNNFEMTRTLRSSGSFSSGYSRSTNATQTYSNGHSISTQTLDSVGDPRFGDDDVEL